MVPVVRDGTVRACLRPPGGERQCTPWDGAHPIHVAPPTDP
jgi:hypothetical protein